MTTRPSNKIKHVRDMIKSTDPALFIDKNMTDQKLPQNTLARDDAPHVWLQKVQINIIFY